METARLFFNLSIGFSAGTWDSGWDSSTPAGYLDEWETNQRIINVIFELFWKNISFWVSRRIGSIWKTGGVGGLGNKTMMFCASWLLGMGAVRSSEWSRNEISDLHAHIAVSSMTLMCCHEKVVKIGMDWYKRGKMCARQYAAPASSYLMKGKGLKENQIM